MAIFGIIFLKLYSGNLISFSDVSYSLFTQFWAQFVFLNVALALFNLLPIPPLDGRKFVKLFIGNAALKAEYILASNPLLMIVIFVILGQSGLLGFVSDRSQIVVNKLMRFINLMR